LAAAFLFSGVRHYIGSIRRIEDEASLSFAREFYHQAISGKKLGESLRLARLSLIKNRGRGSLDWLNYLLYGDPQFAFFEEPKAKIRAKKKFSPAKHKKKIIFSAIALFAIGLIFSLSVFLPTLKPSSMYLFLKSQSEFNRGNNQLALSLGERAIRSDPYFLAVYPIIASASMRLGDKKDALKYYFDYVLYSEKKDDRENLTQAYIKLGWFYYLEGDYSRSYGFYNKALELSRKLNNRFNEAVALRKLAVWYIDRKDFDTALNLLTKGMGIDIEHQRSVEFRKNLASDYFDIGLVFTNKDDYAAAKEFYEKSRKIFESLKLKSELSDCYFNLGEVCMFEKEYKKALDYYARGLSIDLEQGNKSSLASDYNMFGELYTEMGDTNQAEAFFVKAVNLSEEIKSRPELADACNNLGLLYKTLGRKNKAREYWRKSQEIYRSTDRIKYEEVKKQLLELE